MTPSVLKQSEKSFQAAVIELAERLGWMVAHFNDSRREVVDRRSGERKLVGDRSAKGFPDLVLVRGSRLLMIELKTDTGRLSDAQVAWMHALDLVERVEQAVWRPKNWGLIEDALR